MVVALAVLFNLEKMYLDTPNLGFSITEKNEDTNDI